MKQWTILAFTFLTTISLFAQHKTADATVEHAKSVFALAKDGYDNLKPISLVKAAKILISNPQIGRFSAKGKDAYAPNENEVILEHKDFFNVYQLLEDAKKMTAYDDKRMKRRIKRLEKRLPKYQKMGQQFNEIRVKNYLIYGKNSKTIATNFDKNKRVTLSVRVGDQLRLFVLNNLKKQVGKSLNIGDARLVKFKTGNNGKYNITIENTSDEPNDCFLMIETKS